MPSDKAAYLAAHYLTSNSKPSSSSTKKRKRKQATSSGLLITDDDETGWGGSAHQNDAEDDDAPLTVAGATTDFRRTKKSGWKTLGGQPTTTTTTTTTTSTAASADADADAIIASAAAETAAAAAAEAAEDLEPDASTPQMSNGALAGLQSASALSAQLRKRQQLEAAELAQLKAAAAAAAANSTTGDNTETEVILRDATGRRVDASLRRAEARRQAAEAERAERARRDLLTGEVQAAAARSRRERLEEAALQPLARGRDDAELNEALKREERWNDPMAEFVATTDDGVGQAAGKKKKGVGRRPVYKGAAAPNRYGIRPGYRWDGVDRGNGFEAERFKALNRRERDKGLEYAWQMDV
ncbi:putative pre-mRNA splicing protein [Chaetomium sp. MPI-CAGE-AT-0009]|nr:putative pre-mRNA splicing protein [Chaetomium sp. MPI-CAGE-AT-0009]